MTFATRNEIEYLSALDQEASIDRGLFEEPGDRLEALRRYDQCIEETDWHPSGKISHESHEDQLLKDLKPYYGLAYASLRRQR